VSEAAATIAIGGARAAPRSRSSQAWRRFRRHRLAVAGLVVMLVLIVAAAFAPVVAPHPPNFGSLREVRDAPSRNHPLGTDMTGRDVLSRVIYGGRISLAVGVLAVAIYVAIGTALGALAGFFGGLVDGLISRLTDTFMSLPTLLIIIVFVSVVGPSLTSVIAVIGLLGWPGTCRLVRGQVLTLRGQEFVTAARVVGCSDARIILRHVLPNVVSLLIVMATFGMATAILLEASLSFLGLGVRPPTASWGGMLHDAQSPVVLSDLPWLWMAPGAMIAITVLAINFMGDGLRDALDPRMKL
jgi:peptide/nickel transport system permease protein